MCEAFLVKHFQRQENKGFKDKIKGTLFFEIVRILENNSPNYIILENVRNLISHDKGNTWESNKRNIRKIKLQY